MVQRYQLIQDCYMNLDGQPQIVQCGTVIDAVDTEGIHPSTATKLSPTEPATLTPVMSKPKSVRNVRTR